MIDTNASDRIQISRSTGLYAELANMRERRRFVGARFSCSVHRVGKRDYIPDRNQRSKSAFTKKTWHTHAAIGGDDRQTSRDCLNNGGGYAFEIR